MTQEQKPLTIPDLVKVLPEDMIAALQENPEFAQLSYKKALERTVLNLAAALQNPPEPEAELVKEVTGATPEEVESALKQADEIVAGDTKPKKVGS